MEYRQLRSRLNDDWDFAYDHERTGHLFTKKKLPSGMTAEFGCDLYEGGIIDLTFSVYKKRSKPWPDDPSKTTGKDGLLPAIWALDCLGSLEHAIIDVGSPATICLGWEDSRRRDVYEKVLGKRGYYFDYIDREKLLIKKFNDEG